MVVCPEDLRRLYSQGRVVPFVGAGASMAVKWTSNGEERRGPSWAEMVDQAAREVGAQLPELLRLRGSDLQILEYTREKGNKMQRVINWMMRRMDVSDQELTGSKIHQSLAKLSSCRLFYTTNYDDFLERSLSLAGRSVATITSEQDLSQSLDGKTQVVKFHGDFNSPNAMVLSESDYEKRMRFEDPLDLKLRSDILGKVVLFLGYSFRDANVSYLFRRLNEIFGPLPESVDGKRAYIAYAGPSDFENRLFKARNVGIIAIDPRHREDDIMALVDAMTAP